MRSVLRSVRKRKKSRRLGEVDIISREEYAGFDVDAKVEMIRALVPLGLMHVQELLDDEVTELAGARHARKESLVRGRRHGSNPGTVRLAGQRVPIRVPRVRSVAGGEIPLRSSEAAREDGQVNDVLLKRVLYGISCRTYEAAAESVPGAIGLSSSTVSRSFIQASAATLREFQERDLSGEDVVALFLDGKAFADSTMVIALGITISGEKRFLGFMETDTEAAQVLTPFLRSLVDRGLDASQGLLVILDGGKGLRSAVKKVFRDRALVHRCQWHKRENVVSYLPKSELAPAPPARLQPTDVPRGPGCPRAAPRRVGRPEPVGRRQSGGGPGRDPDLAPTQRLCRAGTLVQDDQLSRVRQCAGRGTLRQGRPVEELEPAPAVAGDGARRHRTAPPQGRGLPPPSEASRSIAAGTEDRKEDAEHEGRVMIRSREEFQLRMGLTRARSYACQFPTRYCVLYFGCTFEFTAELCDSSG